MMISLGHPDHAHHSVLAEAALDSGVDDERVLDALDNIPRQWFLPVDEHELSNWDAPLAIGHEQTTSQPSLIARILQELELRPGSRVLEVGTGTGYEASLAAYLAAPDGHVVTIERQPALYDMAKVLIPRCQKRLSLPMAPVEVRLGDGQPGAADRGPFDAIVVAATAQEVPQALKDQLALGGKLIIPVSLGGEWGSRSYASLEVHARTDAGAMKIGSLGTVSYVPLLEGVEPDPAPPIQAMD